MGYYVHTVEGELRIKKENLERGYNLACSINAYDHLKRGGMWGGKPTKRPIDSHSLSQNPDKWFSWLPWNYDVVYGSLEEILTNLGFYCETEENGDLIIKGYDWNKSGQEELFLESIAPVVETGGFLTWMGENDEAWMDCFLKGSISGETVMKVQEIDNLCDYYFVDIFS